MTYTASPHREPAATPTGAVAGLSQRRPTLAGAGAWYGAAGAHVPNGATTMSDSTNRQDVLDGIAEETTTPLEGAPRREARSTADGTSRRSLLATAGAVGATALSGCLGALTGETAEFPAPPGLYRLPSLEDRQDFDVRLEMTPVRLVQARKSFERFGLSREAVATGWGSTVQLRASPEAEAFRAAHGNPPVVDGRATLAEMSLFTVPKVEVGGKERNPVVRASAERVLRRLRGGGADAAPIADGALAATIADLDDVGSMVGGAYDGALEAVGDVSLSPGGARTLAKSAERPMLFTATARRLHGDGDERIIGALQRFELEDAYAFKTIWKSRANDEHADPTVLSTDDGTEGRIQTIDVGSGGDGAGSIMIEDFYDRFPWECRRNKRQCYERCYDDFETGTIELAMCVERCDRRYPCVLLHWATQPVIVDSGNDVAHPHFDPTAAPGDLQPSDVDPCGSGDGDDAEVCIGDVVAEYARKQVPTRRFTE